MKTRDFMKISVGGAVAMSSLNAKENNAGERVEKPKVPFANPSKEAAANAAKNPFGLVYGDAISKNEAGKVNLTPVSYKSRGLDIAANVYTPANFDPNKSYAAVVVAHPNGGVKEQVAGLYAQRLAELGYVAIAFDAAYQGASGGMPRNVDTPANRIEDIRAAADFLLKFKGVDRDRIGVLGICGGGGYTLKAAQTDKIFKAVATLSAFDSGLARRNGFLDAQISTIQQRLKDASDARAKEVLTGEVEYVPDPNLTDEEIAKITNDLYREGLKYYHRTHAHPNSTFAYTKSSLLDLMNFDAASNMDLINQPLLMMVGSKADSAYMSERAFAGASGTQKKEYFKIDGALHIDTYYKPEYVDVAMKKLAQFYGENL